MRSLKNGLGRGLECEGEKGKKLWHVNYKYVTIHLVCSFVDILDVLSKNVKTN